MNCLQLNNYTPSEFNEYRNTLLIIYNVLSTLRASFIGRNVQIISILIFGLVKDKLVDNTASTHVLLY